MAYQWDMGWGTKANRVRSYYHQILVTSLYGMINLQYTDEERWFYSQQADAKLKQETIDQCKNE